MQHRLGLRDYGRQRGLCRLGPRECRNVFTQVLNPARESPCSSGASSRRAVFLHHSVRGWCLPLGRFWCQQPELSHTCLRAISLSPISIPRHSEVNSASTVHQVRKQVTKTQKEQSQTSTQPHQSSTSCKPKDITPEKQPIVSQDSVTLWESHIYAH